MRTNNLSRQIVSSNVIFSLFVLLGLLLAFPPILAETLVATQLSAFGLKTEISAQFDQRVVPQFRSLTTTVVGDKAHYPTASKTIWPSLGHRESSGSVFGRPAGLLLALWAPIAVLGFAGWRLSRGAVFGAGAAPWGAVALGAPPGGGADLGVRPATADDVRAAVAVINEAFMADAFFKTQAHWERTSADQMLAQMQLPDSTFLVAVANERVVGAVCVGWDAKSGKGFFGQLAVAQAFQGRGVGRRLVEAAEGWCRAKGGGQPFAMEIPIVSVRPDLFVFYEKLGYRKLRTVPFAYPFMLSGEYAVEFVMFQKQCGPTEPVLVPPALRLADPGAAPTDDSEATTLPPADPPCKLSLREPAPDFATPVPWGKVAAVGFVLFVNHFASMLVLPFIPFMVADFFPSLPKAQLGMKVGYIFSAFYFGQFAGAYLWGAAADKFGRRPVLLLGTLGTLVTLPWFGMSRTFRQALLARFLWGLLNGNKAICKVYLGETLDRTNAALGFSVLGIQSSLGRWLGPLLGGLLCYPSTKYPALANVALLRRFPYVLPCLVGAVAAAACLGVTVAQLPETLRGQAAPAAVHQGSPKGESKSLAASGRMPSRAFTTSIILAIITYTGFCFAHIGFEQVFPLWLLRDPGQGGFSFREEAIGAVVAMTGPVQLLTQVTVVPWFGKRVSSCTAWQVALTWMAFGVAFAPWAALANCFPGSWLRWAAAAAVYMAVNVPAEAAYTYGAIAVNDSVVASHRGRVNGIVAATTAAVRMAGPVLWGTLFASTAAGRWAIHWHWVFILIAASLMVFANTAKSMARASAAASASPPPASA